jgi:hypothetical protein
MYTHCLRPTESLTWDDVCGLWDNGVYAAEEIEKIASPYFEAAELSDVREVIEKVESDSHTLETVNTDPGDYLKHPAERRKKAA